MNPLYRTTCIFILSAILSACNTAPSTPVLSASPVIPTEIPTEMAIEATSTPIIMEANPFGVSVAQYLLDSAGFHEMATTLSEAQIIDPTYLSTVIRVNKVLTYTTWPTELNEEAQAFIESLGKFAAALEADNVADAVDLSEKVHDAQHEFSHSIDHWMGDAQMSMTEANTFDISVAQYFLDSAGFHEMATALSETQSIDPVYLSTVNHVNKVLMYTAWPSELNAEAQAFVESLGKFAIALETDNVADAVELSETVHDAQHEFSHSIDHWMGDAQVSMTEANTFDISVAQYFLDSAGFHEMATTLSETQSIDPAYLSTVNRVKKVLMYTAWPSELNAEAQGLIKSLDLFAAGLESDNIADAIEISETVHDAQHEFSHSIDHWMEENAQN